MQHRALIALTFALGLALGALFVVGIALPADQIDAEILSLLEAYPLLRPLGVFVALALVLMFAEPSPEGE